MIEGLNFVVFYGLLVVVSVIGLFYFRSKLDESDRLATPSIPINIDPFEIAYLRGGPKELARTVIFSLRQKGAIVIVAAGKSAAVRPAPDAQLISGSAIEQRTLDWIGTGRDAKETFEGSRSLVFALAAQSAAYQRTLEQGQLLVSPEMAGRLSVAKWIAAGSILVFGIFGVGTGPYSDMGLTIALAASGIAGCFVAARTRRITKLGEQYLERLRMAFSRLNQAPAAESSEIDGRTLTPHPLLVSVGVFGGVALAGAVYADYSNAFRKGQREKNSGGCGGGGGCGCGSCGTSTASCCSCSSGGSCGGGGGCGGGCGGS